MTPLSSPGPVLVHTDLFRMRMACQPFEELLYELFPNRPILIPTFNYDFCRTGLYDRRESPSQVGAFTDHVRRKYPHYRTLTPVFNFCVLQNNGLSLEPAENCFGEHSLFAELVRRDGYVFFLGAPFSSNTFLHHIEEVADVSYRHHKRFDGAVIDGDQRRPVSLVYRVRPLTAGSEGVYDWKRLEDDLMARGILSRRGLQGLFFRARDLFDYWQTAIRVKERFLIVK